MALLAACACTAPRQARLADTFRDAELTLRNGALPQALGLAEQGLTLASARADAPWVSRFRLLKSDILLERGDLSSALELLREDLPDGEPDQALRARRRYLLAKALRNQGRFADALNELGEARRAAPEAQDLQLAADWLIGQISFRMSRWQEGESTLVNVAARAAAAGNDYQQALAFLDLGMSHLVRGRYDAAVDWLERALAFGDLKQTTVFAKALNNVGICYARLGLFERASDRQRKAVDLLTRGGPSPALAEALGSLGNTLVLGGRPREGISHLERAFEVAREARLEDNAALWAGNLASALIELGHWDEAERFDEEARRLVKSVTSLKAVYNVLNAAMIAAGRGQVDRATTLFTAALESEEAVPAVRWSAQAGLANLAVTAQQPARATRFFEAALETVEQTRSDLLKTDYKLSFLTQLIAFYRNYVDVLVSQGLDERALEIADSSRGRVLAERQRVAAPKRVGASAWRQVARGTRTVLLSYWLAPTRSYLWVITGEGTRRIDLPPAATIEAAVGDYRQAIDQSLNDPLAAAGTPGDRLYEMLLRPANVPHGASIVIVPDGALHGVNFETLPVDGPRRHYFIEDAEIQVAPSLALLGAARRHRLPASRPAVRDRRPSEVLLIGNPTPRAPDFPALSYAAAEMTSIVGHFPQGRVTAFDGERASPSTYREQPLDRFSMVHFTAHATANVESPLDSAVVLSGPDSAYKLYARDIAETPLNAELVTVSACRSAGERAYAGEGLVGFAWAFLRAGARRVIAGLWDVDDQATARLMDVLYERLSANEPPAQALRAAKLALITGGGRAARPYYWGPLQLFTAQLD